MKKGDNNLQWYKGDDLFKVGWIGPTFNPADLKYADKMLALRRVFQGHNVLAELVDNWKDGLISEPFVWFLKDVNGERVEAADAEIDLQRWLDWVNQQALELDPACTNFQTSSIWAEFVLSLGVLGEANLRLWQPTRYATAADPIKRIHLHVPVAGSVKAARDGDGFLDSLEYNYGNNKKEVQRIEGDRTIVKTGDTDLEVDTGGWWLIQQVRTPSLLTESAKQKQAAICHALTMMLRNQESAGFRERTLLNAEFPEDDDGNPLDVERGPGIDRYEFGIRQGDPSQPSYSTPSIFESEPVPVQTFIDSIQVNRQLLYLEFRQGHLLGVGDAGLSGESRIQQRQGFELFLRGWKMPVESAIANIFNVVLRLLGYTELEAVVQLRITTGKLSAEERAQIMTEVQAGLLSKSTAIAILGTVSDVDAEMELIQSEMEAESRTRLPPRGVDE